MVSQISSLILLAAVIWWVRMYARLRRGSHERTMPAPGPTNPFWHETQEPEGWHTPPPPKDPWYKRTPWIIALLILFPPVGIFLMLRYAPWRQPIRVAALAVFAIILIVVPFLLRPSSTKTAQSGMDIGPSTISSPASSPPPTPTNASPPPAFHWNGPYWTEGAGLADDTVRAALKAEPQDGLSKSLDLNAPSQLQINPSDRTISVTYDATGAKLTHQSDVVELGTDTTYRVFHALFDNPSVQNVTVSITMEMPDTYGKWHTSLVMRLGMNRSRVNGIDWDRLRDLAIDDHDVLFCDADSYYLNPIIQEQILTADCV